MKQFSNRLVSICAVGVVLLSGLVAQAMPARAVPVASAQTYWKGSSAGFQVEWTKGDLRAVDSSSGQTVFSAKDVARSNFESVKKRLPPGTVYEEDYELLSLVGSVLSLEYHARISNGPKSQKRSSAKATQSRGITRYVAIDLQNPAGGIARLSEKYDEATIPSCVKLSDLFSEKDLLAAFTNDTVIQSTIDTEKVATVTDLVKALDGKSLPPPDMCGTFDASLLNEFGVHHLRGSKAALRLGISGAEPRSEILSELGLVVPIPEGVLSKFNLASEGKEGVLMSALKKKAAQARTHFEFKVVGKTSTK
jgi:hypothetical protein